MLESQVADWEMDVTQRESEVTPAQRYHRIMTDYETEAKQLDEKAAQSHARVQKVLLLCTRLLVCLRKQTRLIHLCVANVQALDDRRSRQAALKDESKKMEARMRMMDQCLHKHQARSIPPQLDFQGHFNFLI